MTLVYGSELHPDPLEQALLASPTQIEATIGSAVNTMFGVPPPVLISCGSLQDTDGWQHGPHEYAPPQYLPVAAILLLFPQPFGSAGQVTEPGQQEVTVPVIGAYT